MYTNSMKKTTVMSVQKFHTKYLIERTFNANNSVYVNINNFVNREMIRKEQKLKQSFYSRQIRITILSKSWVTPLSVMIGRT